jgi:hypothetical protein
MSAAPPKQPKLSERGREARRDREARLAEALRANLRKRKAQARGRRGVGAGDGRGGPPEGGEA